MIFQYLDMRFGKSVRKIITHLSIFLGLCFLPIVMYLPSLSFVEGELSNSNELSLKNITIDFFLICHE